MVPEETPTASALSERRAVRNFEADIERPDGERFTASFNINPIYDEDGLLCGTVSVLIDVTEQKRAERQLVQAREALAEQLADMQRLHEISTRLMGTSDITAMLREVLDAVLAVNQTELGMLWLMRPESAQLKLAVSSGFSQEFVEAVEPTLALTGACSVACSERIRVVIDDVHQDSRFANNLDIARFGGFRAVHSTPLITRDHKIIGAIAMYFANPRVPTERELRLSDLYARQAADLIDAAQLRQNLERAKEEAESANRSKDRFLAVLSHELRTPLSPVLMLASSLAEDAELPRRVREDMAVVRRNIELETKLIDDLLDLNRVTSGKLRLQMQPVDLNEEVRHVANICRSQFLEKGIRLECLLDDLIPPLLADPARLQQVLWNVLKNAAKFTHEGGLVQVKTFLKDAGRVAIQVRDNGIGIAPDLLVKIFDAFEQGDPAAVQRSGGLGLGLAISKALIELHQGLLWAESAGVGAGSVFTIELPAAVPDPDPTRSPAAGEDPNAGAHLRLLLVEDHQDTARTLTRLLRSRGYIVQAAANVAAALELFGRDDFDLIISDIGLPDAPGYELMRQIRLRSGITGIAMSGYGMESDIEKSHEAGFSEHLVKPVSVLHLEQAIQRVRGRPVRAHALQ